MEDSATDRRLLRQIQPRNLLSFGPDSEPPALENLNVLIGPNGAGKSNLIEALELWIQGPATAYRPLWRTQPSVRPFRYGA
jgi:predicted ATPase